jgi:hypothetical protein
VWAFNLVAKSELVYEQAVLGGQLIILQLVCQAQRELAFLDVVTGIFPGVR